MKSSVWRGALSLMPNQQNDGGGRSPDGVDAGWPVTDSTRWWPYGHMAINLSVPQTHNTALHCARDGVLCGRSNRRAFVLPFSRSTEAAVPAASCFLYCNTPHHHYCIATPMMDTICCKLPSPPPRPTPPEPHSHINDSLRAMARVVISGGYLGG